MSVQSYLSKKVKEHCEDHVETEMGLKPGDEDYEEELQDLIESMETEIWRDGNIIDTAYYMAIPKKALYTFGYTKEEINRIFLETWDDRQFPDGYPY